MAIRPAPDSEPRKNNGHWAGGQSLAVAIAFKVSRYAAMSSLASLSFWTVSLGVASAVAPPRPGKSSQIASIISCCCSRLACLSSAL